MKTLRVSFEKSPTHLAQIEQWLRRESEATGEGFYCNWEIIEECHSKNTLAYVLAEGKAVAFLAWWRVGGNCNFGIMEVAPGLRRSGIGALLVGSVVARMEASGFSAIKLECVPLESEHFWRKLGFESRPPPRGVAPESRRVFLIKPLHANAAIESDPNNAKARRANA